MVLVEPVHVSDVRHDVVEHKLAQELILAPEQLPDTHAATTTE